MRVEPGSAEEGLAQIALTRQATIHYLTTVSIINAIIQVGNNIASAVSGSPSSGSDSLKKSAEELRKLLFPEEVQRVEEKAKEVKALMESELARGPMTVRPVGSSHLKTSSKGSAPRFRRQ